MQTSVTFKNLNPSDHLKGYVREKLERFDKYLDNPAEATVVLTVEKHRHIVEITIIGDRLNLIGKEETADMYSAIDLTLDKLDKQIKKSKGKIRDRRAASRVPAKEMIAEKSAIPEEASGRQVKVKNIEYKPMDIEEATMQMDLVTDNFLVFTNARTDKVNVLYRRKDGHYGLIQPSN